MLVAFSSYIDDIAFYLALHPPRLLLYDHTFLLLANSSLFLHNFMSRRCCTTYIALVNIDMLLLSFPLLSLSVSLALLVLPSLPDIGFVINKLRKQQ
jgi:hypothetical protein